MKLWDKLWKRPKIVASAILLFWILLVSININKILNISDYVSDEGNNLSTTSQSESSIGAEILSTFSEVNSSFQIIVRNPNGSIVSESMYLKVASLVFNITHNPKIGPYLSPSKPYSSLYVDADNLLRTILSLQWYATQLSFASIHYVWGGIEYFSSTWLDQYNSTNSTFLATTVTKQLTNNYLETLLDSFNESRYYSFVDVFYDELSKSFNYFANLSTPTSEEDVFNLLSSIVNANSTFISEVSADTRQTQLLGLLSNNFNSSEWQNATYSYEKIAEFLFDSNNSFEVDFIREVYDDGNIQGFIDAKNKYFLPVLTMESTIPPITEDIILTFLRQYTNYKESMDDADTTIITFNMALNHLNEEGKAAYLEILDILPSIKEENEPLEIYATGIDLFIVEISQDYQNQAKKTDLIVLITIVVILLLVYRSPILPLIQLFVLAISLGVSRLLFIGIGSLTGGLDSTSLIILSVTLLGATTDYCVFLMGDYLLNLKKTNSKNSALRTTLKRTSKSIIIASISLSFGFGGLVLSSFALATGMGIAGIIGFLTSMVVSLTLVPAILILLNQNILTKWRINLKIFQKRKGSIIKYVKKAVQKPKKVLLVFVIISLVGIGIFIAVPTDYAQISSAPQSYQSRQGLDAITQHMGTEYISQISLLFKTTDVEPFIFSNDSLNYKSINEVLFIIEAIKIETNITVLAGLSHPFGRPYYEHFQNTSLFVTEEIQILMKNFVFSDETYAIVYCGSQYMEGDKRLDEQIKTIRKTISEIIEQREITEWQTYATGFAPVLYDSKTGISFDFNLIFLFVSVTITLLLFLFLRNFFMSVRVLITILLSLGISLGLFSLCALIFLGGSIYWIVPLLAYAVLTALGLDFDVLFLGIFQDIYTDVKDSEKAIVEAVEQTMNNISVAGIIMAATYFSLLFTSSIHMQQLGLGLGIGILIDVFVSRLFIVPPAIVLTFKGEKTKKKNRRGIKDEK
ncbi:MAG: MMPL family transporter [Candidatus Heimdallarchaeota archaeon]|nr:MMPL family transporter [Candidatus Heimdallarchaeota archaeon]MCK4612025.1 MMPL family transporter [Candidatus Heimdallarchaeota archaeon]